MSPVVCTTMVRLSMVIARTSMRPETVADWRISTQRTYSRQRNAGAMPVSGLLYIPLNFSSSTYMVVILQRPQ